MKMSERVRELFGERAVTVFWKQDGKQKGAICNRVAERFLIILEVSEDTPQVMMQQLELELAAYELMKIPEWLSKAVKELLGETVTIHYSTVYTTGSKYTLMDATGRVLLTAEEATQSRAALELNARLRAFLETIRAIP